MPYDRITDLPKRVKDNLPKEAQRLWMSVFNSSYDACKKSGGRDCDTDASIAAWVAVKRNWKKDKEGNWIKKSKQ